MHDPEVQSALEYLKTGGLGEVAGLTELAMNAGHPKVMSDTTMAMALCELAAEALAKPIKTSSSELSTAAAKLMSMDDDELRKASIFIASVNDEPRLYPEFCVLIRNLASSVFPQDETRGQK